MLQNTFDDKSTRQQAITWINVGQVMCCQMATLGYNELSQYGFMTVHLPLVSIDMAIVVLILKHWETPV